MVGLGDSAQAWARLMALRDAPWKARLQAWWEGYEWVDPGAEPEALAKGDDLRLFRAGDGGAEPEVAPVFEEHSIAEGWTEARIKLNEKLWGEGFVSPGGEKVVPGKRL